MTASDPGREWQKDSQMKVVISSLIAAGFVIGQPLLADEQQDVADLRALDQAYAAEWMRGNADGVLALFTDDATLVPHHGDTPIKGRHAIRKFWFNPEYPPTKIQEWLRRPAEVLVLGDVGVVRGRARLIWDYDGTRTTNPEGNYVLIAVRGTQGWRIRMLTWNDDPRSWLQEPIEKD
jgi:uncharacterized protein (TIGR02246 family)